MIRVLFKFAKLPSLVDGKKPVVIDTTSNSGDFRELSPFVLPAPPAKNFENLWQFSKVYPHHWSEEYQMPDADWLEWRENGFADSKAHRYPMGKGAIPICSWWHGEQLGYIEARKKIYAPEYAQNVKHTTSYHRLNELYAKCCDDGRELILLDYDAYDHIKLGMSMIDVINNSERKMGHGFVLIMMLTDLLETCLNSKATK